MNYKALGIRTLVALIFGPIVLACVWFGGYFLFGMVLCVVFLSYWEYVRLAERKQAYGQLVSGLLMAVGGVVMIFYRPQSLLAWVIIAATLFFFVEIYRKKGSPLLNLGVTFFGVVYYTLFFGSFLLVRQLPLAYGLPYDAAAKWLLLVIFTTWVCDSAAYFIGSWWGRHKLIARISPNKTIEGTVAGFIFGVLTAYLCHIWFIEYLSLLDSLVIGALVSSLGQYGDLFESMLKRDAGVKDTSNLIPGHGGFLDRFDGLTAVVPLVYLYLKYIVL